MILYCVRHGESVYNAEGRIQGQSDVPLSRFGQRQGKAVAAAMSDLPIDAIFASPLERAMQTAQAIAARVDLPIKIEPRLKEIDVGIFQDKLPEDLIRLHPAEFARWQSGAIDFVIPRGESRLQLMRRGGDALRSIATTPHKHVAVVAHGRLLILTIKALFDIPLDDPPSSLHNGSISRIEFPAAGKPRLLGINEIEHLREVGAGGTGDL